MRRIIHNTTAIAACLSLLAPHLAMAQSEAPADASTEQAAPAPEPCADGSAPPCAAAPAAEPAAEAEAKPAETAPPAEAAPAPAEAAPAEAPAATAAPAAAEPVIAPAPSDADALKAALAAEEAKEAPAEPKAATETTPAEEKPAEAKPAEAKPAEEKPAEAKPADAAAADTKAAETKPAETTPADTKPAETAPAAETDADALKAALAAEEAKSADAAKDAAKPDADATPAAPASEAATTPATPAEAAPEADAKETEAAREAAAAVAAPVAAALGGDAAAAEVSEEKVTEENSRSSSEDFATSLRDALAGTPAAGAATQKDDGDDKKSDLAKAVLLGLGGVAVGAMLANNRQVALSSPDRVVVTRPDGSQQVIKDEVALLRQPGSTVKTENYNDGSSRTIVTRADGSQVVTIRDADLRVLRRTLVTPDGRMQDLIDDTAAKPVDIATLPKPAPTNTATASQMDEAQLRAALMAASAADRRFTLSQIRDIAQVRSLVAPVNIDSITFDTGSAAIKSDQAQQLSALGNVIRDSIAKNPGEIFMIEGYTDTVGSDAANLALSDRRAESVALALTEYFDVPPENMVVQGYGEQFLLVKREGDVRENRRASVRRITELLQTASN